MSKSKGSRRLPALQLTSSSGWPKDSESLFFFLGRICTEHHSTEYFSFQHDEREQGKYRIRHPISLKKGHRNLVDNNVEESTDSKEGGVLLFSGWIMRGCYTARPIDTHCLAVRRLAVALNNNIGETYRGFHLLRRRHGLLGKLPSHSLQEPWSQLIHPL